MPQDKQGQKRQPFFKRLNFILTIVTVIIIAALAIIFKYKALLPITILLVLFVAIMVNRKIIHLKKRGNSQNVSHYDLSDSELSRLSQYFVSRDEKYISSLGNGYIMNYLASGNLSRGFAVISNKRVYFRGTCFSGQGKSLVKTNEERTVDIKDVTGSGFIYRRYIGILLGLFAVHVALVGGICGNVVLLSRSWENTKNYQEQAEEAQDIIDRINRSENRIKTIKVQIDDNQLSIKEQQAQLSELTQAAVENAAPESISVNEILYDTEINAAFEEYLYEMDSIFQQSEFYEVLTVLRDAALEEAAHPFSSTTEEKADTVIKGTDNLYDYTMDGNMLVSYYEQNQYPSDDMLSFCTNIIGIPYEIMQMAVTVVHSYWLEPDSGNLAEMYFGDNKYTAYCGVIFGDYEYLDDANLSLWLSSEEQTLISSAHQNFIAQVAPAYLDSVTEPTLEEIVLNYLSEHPEASFVDKIGNSGITTEYDSEIDKVTEKIASLEKDNSALSAEFAELSELRNNRSHYEAKYDNMERRASSSFSTTAFAAIVAGLLVTFFISSFLVFFDYLVKRKTMFQIQYAGGNIAFNVSYYAKAEIDDFQKKLRQAKDLAEESIVKTAVTTPPMQSLSQNSVPDDLRKYADLLKEGLISQEEYDAMKKKILNL